MEKIKSVRDTHVELYGLALPWNVPFESECLIRLKANGVWYDRVKNVVYTFYCFKPHPHVYSRARTHAHILNLMQLNVQLCLIANFINSIIFTKWTVFTVQRNFFGIRRAYSSFRLNIHILSTVWTIFSRVFKMIKCFFWAIFLAAAYQTCISKLKKMTQKIFFGHLSTKFESLT